MLSKILLLSIEKQNTDILELVARSVREMSEGELLQMEKSRLLDITEEIYFEVIRKKTASLLSTSCEAGCLAAGALEHRETMRSFGEKVGLAFQIKDDIFDFGDSENIGKPTGNDIREQKLTLPMIYTLNHAPAEEVKALKFIVKNQNNKEESVRKAIDIVLRNGGIQYADAMMRKIGEEAKGLLADLPDNDAKASLIALVDYTMNRTK
jgi:octaprenyl-diphosphate synthase